MNEIEILQHISQVLDVHLAPNDALEQARILEGRAEEYARLAASGPSDDAPRDATLALLCLSVAKLLAR